MTAPTIDCVIVGGGVAGLWTRWALSHAGYDVLLVERDALGALQTTASQGILHRGVKYALSPAAAEAGRTLEAARMLWERALLGEGGPDLRNVERTASRMHLWTRPGLMGALTGTAASLAMRSGVRRLEAGEARPEAFTSAPRGVSLWEVEEEALVPSSLVRTLAAQSGGPIRKGEVFSATPREGGGVTLSIRLAEGEKQVDARVVILAAGEGNELLVQAFSDARLMQRRPLHMVVGRGAPCDVSGHCLNELSDKPRLTVTTLRGPYGVRCWSLGGDLAESGVDRSHDEQIIAARRVLNECLGWLDTAAMQLGTIRVDRAEGLSPGGKRPDSFVMRELGDTLVIWPTKMALAPVLAEAVVERVRARGLMGGSLALKGSTTEECPIANDLPWWGGVRWS